MKWNWKWKIPYTVLERWTLCFRSHKNCKLKVQCDGASNRKKGIFVTFILSQEHFLTFLFYLSALNTLSEYAYTFIYQKTLLHKLFCLFLELLEAFSVSWKQKATCPSHSFLSILFYYQHFKQFCNKETNLCHI